MSNVVVLTGDGVKKYDVHDDVRLAQAREQLAALGFPVAIRGSERGYSTAGDILPRVTQTADGVDLNAIWAEQQAMAEVNNSQVDALVSLLFYRTTNVADPVPQTMQGAEFVEASEFGLPTSVRTAGGVLLVAYGFRDYDVRTGYTWRFLRDADSRQVAAVAASVVAGDREHLQKRVLAALMVNEMRMSPENRDIYPLYNGDSFVPPDYMGQSFPAPHTHYLTTESVLPDPIDVESLMRHVTHHGYGKTTGSRLLLMGNEETVAPVTGFRAGVTANEGSPGTFAKYDFVPGQGAPAYMTTDLIYGDRAPESFNKIPLLGSYGPAWVLTNEVIPNGYLLVVATDGPGSDRNPVAFREHANPAYQGLRLLPGTVPGYPLQDSIYSRSFGTGVRHRGAAAVLQVTTATSYTSPNFDLP